MQWSNRIFRLLNGENGLKLVKIDQKQVKMVKKLKNGQKPQKRPRFLADQKKALEKTLIEIGHFSSESGPPLGFEQKSSKNPIFDHFLSFFAVFCKKLTFLSRQAVCTLATCPICMCTIQILVQIPKNTRGMRKIRFTTLFFYLLNVLRTGTTENFPNSPCILGIQ